MIPFALEHSFRIFLSPKREKVINMGDKMGRRKFLSKATVGALTVQTAGESSKGAPNESKAKIRRI
jgi:hypothetical protein